MVKCLECEADIKVDDDVDVDDPLVCEKCGTRFVVVEVDPLEIDYADDDEEWEDEDWEDDDWDDEDDE